MKKLLLITMLALGATQAMAASIVGNLPAVPAQRISGGLTSLDALCQSLNQQRLAQGEAPLSYSQCYEWYSIGMVPTVPVVRR
jgi:hypothetical protein